MRIVRFKKESCDFAQYGVIDGEDIKYLGGDLFKQYNIGDAAGNIKEVMLLSPCLPGKVVALAANYSGATGVTQGMSEPVVFIKPAASITGPYDDIIFPFKNVKAWGESELGIVIGKQLCKATMGEAKEAIFGLGILKALDYDKSKKGHLIVFSLNIRSLSFLKKIFIAL